jgi:hypothetical protein
MLMIVENIYLLDLIVIWYYITWSYQFFCRKTIIPIVLLKFSVQICGEPAGWPLVAAKLFGAGPPGQLSNDNF